MAELTKRFRPGRGLVRTFVVIAVLLATLLQLLTRNFANFPNPDAGSVHAVPPDVWGVALVALSTLVLLVGSRPVVVLTLSCLGSVALVTLKYGVIVHLAPAVAIYVIARSWYQEQVKTVVLGIAGASFVAIAVLEWTRLEAHGDFWIDAVLWAGAWASGRQRRAAEEQRRQDVRREHELIAAQERSAIARELHDSAGHALNIILAFAGVARVLRTRDPEGSASAIETIETTARQVISEIDQIVGMLHTEPTADVDPLPGSKHVGTLVEQHRRAGMEVGLHEEGRRSDLRLSPAVDRAIFRLVQELLTNCSRHGDGKAELHVRYAGSQVGIRCSNGIGQRKTRHAGGKGLVGLRERVVLLGGHVDIADGPETFTVTIRLPLEPESP